VSPQRAGDATEESGAFGGWHATPALLRAARTIKPLRNLGGIVMRMLRDGLPAMRIGAGQSHVKTLPECKMHCADIAQASV